MDLGLSGKVAIVTGASRGIGRAIAQLLSAEGMRVVLVARRIPGAVVGAASAAIAVHPETASKGNRG